MRTTPGQLLGAGGRMRGETQLLGPDDHDDGGTRRHVGPVCGGEQPVRRADDAGAVPPFLDDAVDEIRVADEVRHEARGRPAA